MEQRESARNQGFQVLCDRGLGIVTMESDSATEARKIIGRKDPHITWRKIRHADTAGKRGIEPDESHPPSLLGRNEDMLSEIENSMRNGLDRLLLNTNRETPSKGVAAPKE